MSFGPFRISCVSRQICNSTAVCVVGGGGGVCCSGLPHFSHFVLVTVSVMECVCVCVNCFLGIGAEQNGLLHQDSDGGERERKSCDSSLRLFFGQSQPGDVAPCVSRDVERRRNTSGQQHFAEQ